MYLIIEKKFYETHVLEYETKEEVIGFFDEGEYVEDYKVYKAEGLKIKKTVSIEIEVEDD